MASGLEFDGCCYLSYIPIGAYMIGERHSALRRSSTTGLRRVSRFRGTYTSTFCLLAYFALFVFFFFCFFIVTHPYACYELFKKFSLALLPLVRSSSLATFALSLSFSLFFLDFFAGFFRTKQNGIFLALEEKIHSSTFISLIRLLSSIVSPSTFSIRLN